MKEEAQEWPAVPKTSTEARAEVATVVVKGETIRI
jgi:hypothetical protein